MRFLLGLVIGLALGGAGVWQYTSRASTQQAQVLDMSRRSIVTKLSTLRNLETARQTIQKTIEWRQQLNSFLPGSNLATIIQNFLFQDDLVMEVQADITAGFDLSNFTGDSVSFDPDGSVVIALPPAKILSSVLTDDTIPLDRQLGVLTKWNPDLETKLRNQAIVTITAEAISGGILTQAESGALPAFQSLFSPAGITVSRVVFTQPLQ